MVALTEKAIEINSDRATYSDCNPWIVPKNDATRDFEKKLIGKFYTSTYQEIIFDEFYRHVDQ